MEEEKKDQMEDKKSSFHDSSIMNKSGSLKELDQDRIVWSKKQLDYINSKVEEKDQIPVVQRDGKTFGIRANKEMSFGKCVKSLFFPNHNEWVNLILYFGFAIYFLVECCLIITKNQQYDFNETHDYYFMFIATFGIFVSLTITFFYYLLYPVSKS